MPVLSEQSVKELQAAASAARVEALLSALPTRLWPHTLVIIKPDLRAHVRWLIAQLGTPARLPNELLLEIFRLLSLWDRVRAATVCRRWRTVSLRATSALWTDIPLLRNQDTYLPLLARAADSPITLHCKPLDLSSVAWFCDLISRNLHCIKGLRLSCPNLGYGNDAAVFEHLERILRGRAPILESLSISKDGVLPALARSSYPLLSSPILRTIELNIVPLSCLKSCRLPPGPRSLKMVPQMNRSTPSQSEWFVLSALPTLEVLALQLRFISIDVPPHSTLLPQSLQHLYLELRPDCFDVLVALDDLSPLQTLCVTFLNQCQELRRLVDLLPFLRETTTSASVYDFLSRSSLMTADARGKKRILQKITFGEGWHTLLPNITRLWLTLYQVDSTAPPGGIVPFPALEELTVDAMRPGDPGLPAWPTISSPQLRVVHFVSGKLRPGLPADSVLDYLGRIVTRRLERLIFDVGVLIPTPGVDSSAAALQALAEEVETVRSERLWPELYSSWFTDWAAIPGF